MAPPLAARGSGPLGSRSSLAHSRTRRAPNHRVGLGEGRRRVRYRGRSFQDETALSHGGFPRRRRVGAPVCRSGTRWAEPTGVGGVAGVGGLLECAVVQYAAAGFHECRPGPAAYPAHIYGAVQVQLHCRMSLFGGHVSRIVPAVEQSRDLGTQIQPHHTRPPCQPRRSCCPRWVSGCAHTTNSSP